MLPRDLNLINESLLTELCQQSCPESSILDFKRDLPRRDDRGEFLKDVCAFANAGGGDIVYGVAEKDSSAHSIVPITTEPADAAMRRLGQILDAKAEPRVMNVVLHPVNVTGGYVLVCRVPQSFVGPHRFDNDGNWRFVVRVGTRTADLTYEQLRRAFDRTSSLVEQVKRFRDDRLARIVSGQSWRPMLDGPLCVLHFIPLAALAGTASFDVATLQNNYLPFMFSDWGGASRSLNLDGLVVYHATGKNESAAHTQIFRTGALEAVRTGRALFTDEKVMASFTVSAFYREATQRFVEAARKAGFTGPAVVALALMRIEGYAFGYTDDQGFTEPAISDRSDLVIPPAWLDRIEADDFEQIARVQLDILWQSFGLERCAAYDRQGNWKAK